MGAKKENSTVVAESDDGQGESQARGEWGGQLEFILTCVGYAVGLGNVWRFPYLCFKHGGGSFLIPYVLMLLFVGLPIFLFELSLGQFASLGPISIWQVNPLFKGVGYGMIAVSWLISLYYNVIIAYALYFFFASMTNNLPWTDCSNSWNTRFCITANISRAESGNNISNVSDLKTPSEEYFYRHVLKMSDGIDDMGGIVWQLALCLLLAWVIVFCVLIKGIASLGKIVYFTSTFPYFMMTAMIVRGALLDGAGEGVKSYLKPDIEKLKNSEVWSDAGTQIFYSLSACSGGLIAMASYNKFNNNVLRDSLIVPFINCFTSIFAGFAIFSVLGFMAKLKNVPIEQVAQSGPGLVFVVYPEGLSQMPAPYVWSLLFFFMMMMLGFSSEFSIAEAVFVALMDEFPQLRANKWRPIMFRGVCMTIFYLITLPMVAKGGFYLFSLVDNTVSGFPLLIIGFFELTSIVWIYGYNRFKEDYAMMLGKYPPLYFFLTWCIITPLALITVTVFKITQYKSPTLFDGKYTYPKWAEALSWLIVAFTLVFMPCFWIYQILKNGAWSAIKKAASPTPQWGPHDAVDREGTRYNIPQVTLRPHSKISYSNDRSSTASVYGYSKAVSMSDPRNQDFRKSQLTDTVESIYSNPNQTSSFRNVSNQNINTVMGQEIPLGTQLQHAYDNKGLIPSNEEYAHTLSNEVVLDAVKAAAESSNKANYQHGF
ncbi:DgyrCDS11014 [Dimorphilus gyrociliatus]|uniref:Transporter n=1 Tax=Dimorphilus gyrociliatus TaxID=2664684 RepID=A0A7I8W401_9ANNE|nr:DgyrCDS11014 [Dimorphilus gyrociliatus]